MYAMYLQVVILSPLLGDLMVASSCVFLCTCQTFSATKLRSDMQHTVGSFIYL